MAPPTPPADPETVEITLSTPLAPGDAEQLARTFAALADPVRLRLLSLIASSGERCSCDLEEPLGKSQPTVSHHTKALAAAGLIVGDKRGKWMWWRVVPERVDALRHVLAVRDPDTLVADPTCCP
jgi:ArsR family transcriptional regulator, arsenate/arsenite/antimonite-responsive transcriptional repressor